MKRFSTEIRKEQIKEAALEIIYQSGISKFTTRRLAEKIGVSEGTIFRHFASKNAIILEILNDVEIQLLSVMREIRDEELTSVVRLQMIVCQTIHYIARNKGLSVLMLSEIAEQNHPEFQQKVHDIFSGQREIIEDIVVQGINNEELSNDSDPQAFSLLFMGIPVGVHIELLMKKSEFVEEGFCQRMSKTFLQAFISGNQSLIFNNQHNL
jgi:AcrR family transcriptional regulator